MKRYSLLLILLASFAFLSCSSSGGGSSVETVADVGGSPDGVTVADSGNIYVTDISSGEILQITEDGDVSTIYTVTGGHPDGIVAVTEGTTDTVYVANTGSTEGGTSTDGSIIQLEVSENGSVNTTTNFVNSDVLDSPSGLAVDNDGDLYVTDENTGNIYTIPIDGNGDAGTPESLTDNLGTGVDIENPHGLTLVNNDDGSVTLYSTDAGTSSNNIVQVDIPASGNIVDTIVTELTSDSTGGSVTGTVDEAQFDSPHGITLNGNGTIFVADENNNTIQIITPSGNVINFAGNGTAGDVDGDAETAQFNKPRGLAIDNDGNLLVCDYGNGKVKKVTQ